LRLRLSFSWRFDSSGRTIAKNEQEILETKLLLVDDEEAFAAAMEKRLTMMNVKIATAYTGEEESTKLCLASVKMRIGIRHF
jgi:response regulator RpfG family c-di-GMP phosphodiesterase